MTVLKDLDRFHLVMVTLDRLPQLKDRTAYLKQEMQDKLVEQKYYIKKNGLDMPEIRNWKCKICVSGYLHDSYRDAEM